jgi:hypothetical protein
MTRVVHPPSRTFRATRGIRQDFTHHPHAAGLVGEFDVTVFRRSKLLAKVIVFDRPPSLRKFWRKAFNYPIPSALGVVKALYLDIENYRNGKRINRHREVDPRYFCVIGLCQGHLGTNIICHESVHAAFAYKNRLNRAGLFPRDRDNPEEAICYPSGIIASAIVRNLNQQGLRP